MYIFWTPNLNNVHLCILSVRRWLRVHNIYNTSIKYARTSAASLSIISLSCTPDERSTRGGASSEEIRSSASSRSEPRTPRRWRTPGRRISPPGPGTTRTGHVSQHHIKILHIRNLFCLVFAGFLLRVAYKCTNGFIYWQQTKSSPANNCRPKG